MVNIEAILGSYGTLLAAKTAYHSLIKRDNVGLGLIGAREVIYQNDSELRSFKRGADSRLFTLKQHGEWYDFNLDEVSEPSYLTNKNGLVISLEEGIEDDDNLLASKKVKKIAQVKSNDKQGLQQLLSDLGNELKEGDLFYMGITRHGAIKCKNTLARKLRLGEPVMYGFGEQRDEYIEVDEFKQMFKPVAESGACNVVYFDMCYGGSFAERVATGNTIAIGGKIGKRIAYKHEADLGQMMSGNLKPTSNSTPARDSFQSAFLSQGLNVLEAFYETEILRSMFGFFLPIPVSNPLRMYVGNIDPKSIRITDKKFHPIKKTQN